MFDEATGGLVAPRPAVAEVAVVIRLLLVSLGTKTDKGAAQERKKDRHQ